MGYINRCEDFAARIECVDFDACNAPLGFGCGFPANFAAECAYRKRRPAGACAARAPRVWADEGLALAISVAGGLWSRGRKFGIL